MDVCEPKLYAKYIFLECYQRNITNHSHTGSLKLRVYYMQKSVDYFYRHITLGYDFLHCTGYSILKTNLEIKKCSFLKKKLLASRN